jgi:hypothetical protein
MLPVLALMFGLSHHGLAQSPARADVAFPCQELLGRPTDHSVTVNACADADIEAYYEYGTAPGQYTAQTSVEQHTANTPFFVVLDGLKPDTRYTYRMRYRTLGSTSYESRGEHAFTTQRQRGASFSFAIEADPHMDVNTVPDLYRRTLANILAGGNDFLVDLGDTFMSEKLTVYSDDSIRYRHMLMRSMFDLTCHSVPLYLVLGNHEGEQGWRLDGTQNSLPVVTSNFRTTLFPNPLNDGFYSGNTVSETFVGLRQNYYSWEWGNALFVVLDPYWYTTVKAGKNGDGWTWTLGRAQYDWFENVLRGSQARYKFVFAHQIIGGDSEGRGGTEMVDFFEMGGRNADSSWGFDSKRVGWALPIHQLMLKYHVNAYFHGHDHFFDHQVKDGLTYQLVPQPGNPNFRNANQAANYGYLTGDILPCAGYLRITVADTAATVDYIRSYLPADENGTRHNGDISFSYILRPSGTASGVDDGGGMAPAGVWLAYYYPNPVRSVVNFRYYLPSTAQARLAIHDLLGRMVGVVTEGVQAAGWHETGWSTASSFRGTLRPGIYLAVLESNAGRSVSKILITD